MDPSATNPPASAQSPTSAAQLPRARSKEDLELAERLIEHSQAARLNNRESSPPIQSRLEDQTSPLPTDAEPHSHGEGHQLPADAETHSHGDGDVDGEDMNQMSDDGASSSNNNLLPSIHELTWVKQRKPFNTGMGGAGQVCR